MSSEDDIELHDRHDPGRDHDHDHDHHKGDRLRRLGHLVLLGPRENEGSDYVHVYSLAEWRDSDFWRALVAGALPPFEHPCATEGVISRHNHEQSAWPPSFSSASAYS
jgi:hypothetical protein